MSNLANESMIKYENEDHFDSTDKLKVFRYKPGPNNSRKYTNRSGLYRVSQKTNRNNIFWSGYMTFYTSNEPKVN